MSNYPDHEEIPFEEPNPNSVPNEQPEQENPDGYSEDDPDPDATDPDADPDQSGTDGMQTVDDARMAERQTQRT